MPKIMFKNMNVYKTDDEKLAVLLKHNINKNLSLAWIGKNEEIKDAKEKPALLEFNGEKFYFYSNDIQEINNQKLKENNEYILNNDNQKELISNLDKNLDVDNIKLKMTLLELKVEALEKEKEALEWKNVDLNLNNANLELENLDLKLKKNFDKQDIEQSSKTNNLTLKQKSIPSTDVKNLVHQLADLKKINEIQEYKIKALSGVKDNLCRVIGISFKVHDEIASKSKAVLKIKEQPKSEFKKFIMSVDFVSQVILNKFDYETKHLNQNDNYYKRVKEFYDQDVFEVVEKLKLLNNQKSKDLKTKQKRLEPIEEELELE